MIIQTCDKEGVKEFIKAEVVKSISAGNSDPFIVTDLSRVVERYRLWQECFPNIQPFYAIKAQNNAPVRKLLGSLGCGFDCASLSEIQDVISSGVKPEDIIFAQPYKFLSHLKEALILGLITVCDVVSEVVKVGQTAKGLGVRPRVLVRILPVGSTDAHKMSAKFGAPFETVQDMSKAAKEAGVDIVGISFHIGSGSNNFAAFVTTLVVARRWWDALAKAGFTLTVLDIGGGFPGEGGDLFTQFADVITQSLGDSFGDIRDEIDVIAEPGRFIVTSSQTIVTEVIAKKGNIS